MDCVFCNKRIVKPTRVASTRCKKCGCSFTTDHTASVIKTASYSNRSNTVSVDYDFINNTVTMTHYNPGSLIQDASATVRYDSSKHSLQQMKMKCGIK